MKYYPLDNHKLYQEIKLSELSDADIILGMIAAYNRPACDADHTNADNFKEHLATDECRYFKYVSGESQGMSDHYNMRWFKEWAQINRPNLLKRLYSLKVFW